MGEFPPTIKLKFLLLANNTFARDFPNLFEEFGDLNFVDIGNNVFMGGFPNSIFDFQTSVEIVYVCLSNFTGQLPFTFSKASKL